MGRKRGPKPVAAAGSLDEPGAWRPLVNAFLDSRRVKGFSEHTIYGYEKSLRYFIGWCEERNLLRPRELTRPVLERYQRHLYYQRREDGRALSFRTQHGRMIAIVQLFRWLTRSGHILSNPASDLELPKLGLQLPRTVLSIEEVERVMSAPDLGTSLGIRDRAILETLYSTGMRRSEACGLGLYDINPGGTVMIRRGKGRKDRMVPIGERALAWVEKYLTEVRPTFVREPDEGVIFLAAEGEPLTPGQVGRLVRNWVVASGISKRGSAHMLRHTMATLMLEAGADIRFIQAILGHVRLDTTQIYTHVAIKKLKEVHTLMHPSSTVGRREYPAATASEETRAELLSSLAAEADAESAEDVAGDEMPHYRRKQSRAPAPTGEEIESRPR